MIFDKIFIGLKSDSQSIDITLILDNEITLEFSSFYFSYIPWVDDSLAILSPQLVITLSLSLPLLALSDLPFNSNINTDDENILFDTEDELNLLPSSSR